MILNTRLSLSTVVKRGEPLSADLGGELVLMSIESGKYYGLDKIGSDIWERLISPIRVDALCAELASEYDAESVVIEGDVLALMEKLLEQDLIEVKS